MGWVCNTLFGGDALEVLIRTRGSGAQGDFNYQGISDPELDRLTEESLQVFAAVKSVAIDGATVGP